MLAGLLPLGQFQADVAAAGQAGGRAAQQLFVLELLGFRAQPRPTAEAEVDDAFEGQGVASQLVRFALDDATERGFRIVPVCPMVAAYIRKNEEFSDIVDRPTPDILQWVRTL